MTKLNKQMAELKLEPIRNQNKNLLQRATQRVSEMLGRSEPVARMFGTFTGWNILDLPTIDYGRVNYALTRAIFYASIVKDRKTGKEYGKKFQYGAVFGKAIVNAATAFVVGETPHIETDETDTEGDVQELMNTWLTDYEGQVYKWIRNGMRDGDSYLRLNRDLTVERINPDLVTKKVDPITGKTSGYDIEWTVEEPATATTEKVKYSLRQEYRMASPYYRLLKVKDKETTPEELDTITDDSGENAERSLPIIHLANEQEANEVYGNTDYQNCYNLMGAYHAGYNSWAENIVFNNTSVPVVEGVKDPKSFMEQNGKQDKDGNYQVDWKGRSFIVIGEGGSTKFMQTDSNSSMASEKFLDRTFTLLAVASETPEYFLGKEMTSARATAKEQLMIMIQKAQRKQKEYTPVMNALVDLVLETMKRNGDITIELPTYKLVWGKILDDDLDMNLKVVDALKREGIITDRTAAIMVGLPKYVEDVDQEIEWAREENKEKAGDVDPFKTPTAEEQLEEEPDVEEDTQKPIGEMADPKPKKKKAKKKTK